MTQTSVDRVVRFNLEASRNGGWEFLLGRRSGEDAVKAKKEQEARIEGAELRIVKVITTREVLK